LQPDETSVRWLHRQRRRFKPPQDEVLWTLMVSSAAIRRVSNHEARWMPDYDTPTRNMT
jgi:hypothetical protein